MPQSIPRAYRITIDQDGDQFKLESAQRIEKIVPASEPSQRPDAESGSWFTLDDASGRPLYRRALENLYAQGEVDADDRRGIARVGKVQSKGTLSLLLPDLPEARSLTIHSSHSAAGRKAGAARPMMKLNLRDIAEMAAKQGGRNERR